MKKVILSVLALVAAFCLGYAEEYPVLSVPEKPLSAPAALWRSIDHVLGKYAAKVEVNYTKDALVIVCSGNVEKVVSSKGDGPYAIFGGCTAEIFLQPDPAKPEYYQFAVSPDNRLYQAKGWDCTWKPAVPIETSTESQEKFWRAEFKIPFSALGCKTPGKGEKWKANFVFGKSWSPTSDYHDPSQFGTLIFGEDAPQGVEVDEFTYRDGNLNLVLTNRGSTAAKIEYRDERGGETEIQPGKTVRRDAKIEFGNAHKNIHKFGVCVTQNGKTYSFSGLAPVTDPDNAGLEKFYYYYAQGELTSVYYYPLPYEFSRGTATASVQPKEFFESVQVPQGKLSLKDGHFEIGGVPYYPVVGAKNAPLKIKGCLSSGFTRTPVTGAVFETDPKVTENVFTQADKKNEPTLFRIQYESQLTILLKDADGKIRVEPDQISFYEAAYRKLKKLHQDAVISIQADGAEQREGRIARCCDVFEYASWGSSYAPALMAYLEEDLDSLLAEAKGKPVMFWLGGFKSGGANRSAEELRAAVFLSIIKGCAGNVLHLGHGGLPKHDTHAQDLVAHIQNEVNSFYADFVSGRDVTKEFSIDKSTAKGIRFAVRRLKNGTDLLVAVNTEPFAGKVCLPGGRSKDIAPYGVRVLYFPWRSFYPSLLEKHD